MKCAHYSCDNDVTPTKRGRPRRFCCDAHKTADYKRRRAAGELPRIASAVTGLPGEASLVDTKADPDIQVVASVHETILLINSYRRLSVDARLELAIRCEAMADTLETALRDNFRGAIHDE